ncbi:hypothetical protein [Nonomuraea jabiensis]|uniref:hypothetical protein n=1 Tax=Nonomuraea jabiensis TaxID=882448 RepID=UPI003D707BFB
MGKSRRRAGLVYATWDGRRLVVIGDEVLDGLQVASRFLQRLAGRLLVVEHGLLNDLRAVDMLSIVPDPVTRAVVDLEAHRDHTGAHPGKVLIEIIVGLDDSDDDAIAPEAIMPLLQPAILVLDELCDDDKRTLVQLIIDCADEEPDDDRQLTAWEMPEILGLIA